MELSRRGLLASILGAVVAGSVVSISSKALADPIVSRYAKVVQLQQKLYAVNSTFKIECALARERKDTRAANYPFYGSVLVLHDRIQIAGDELFDYMLTNFEYDKNDSEIGYQIGDIFNLNINYDTLSESDLRKLLDGVIPVAVVKHAIVVEKCAFDTNKMSKFQEFTDRYIDTIMGGHRPV